MNRTTFDAMVAQYAKPTIAGEGAVSWDKGVRCVIPEVLIGGKAVQTQYSGKNLLDFGAEIKTEKIILANCWYVGIAVNDFMQSSLLNDWYIDEQSKTLMVNQSVYGYGIGYSLQVEPSKTYCVSADFSGEIGIGYYDATGVWISFESSGHKTKVFTPPEDAHIAIIVFRAVTLNADTICKAIQIEEGTTPTAYEPYTGGVPAPNPNYPIEPVFSEGTEVVSRGKNLITYPYAHPSGRVHNGITFTVLPDRGIHAQGTATDTAFFILMMNCNFGKENISSILWESATNGLYTLNKSLFYNSSNGTLSLQVFGGKVVDEIYYPQAELGTTATPYIPYHDGGTAKAPELLAIPGTEYRDEWDAQTGKGVRRCAVIASYAGETIDTPYISSTGELSEGAYVVYGIPATPFQTAPQPLIAPKGTGHIMQVGGTLDAVPITAKYVAHS